MYSKCMISPEHKEIEMCCNPGKIPEHVKVLNELVVHQL